MSESTDNPKATRFRRRFIVVYVLFIVGSVGLSAYLGKGSFGHFCMAFGCAFLGVFALVLGLLLYLVRRSPSKRWETAFRRAVTCLIFISIPLLVQPVSIPLGHPLLEGEIEAAKSYCEALVPALGQYKAQNGRYPNNIEQLEPEGQRLPWLLRGIWQKHFYGCDRKGEFFWFHVHDPEGMMGFWKFDSEDRKWRRKH